MRSYVRIVDLQRRDKKKYIKCQLNLYDRVRIFIDGITCVENAYLLTWFLAMKNFVQSKRTRFMAAEHACSMNERICVRKQTFIALLSRDSLTSIQLDHLSIELSNLSTVSS